MSGGWAGPQAIFLGLANDPVEVFWSRYRLNQTKDRLQGGCGRRVAFLSQAPEGSRQIDRLAGFVLLDRIKREEVERIDSLGQPQRVTFADVEEGIARLDAASLAFGLR